jgi:hypothetical protein
MLPGKLLEKYSWSFLFEEYIYDARILANADIVVISTLTIQSIDA